MFQAAERFGMDDPVTIPLPNRTDRALGFFMQPPCRIITVGGIGSQINPFNFLPFFAHLDFCCLQIARQFFFGDNEAAPAFAGFKPAGFDFFDDKRVGKGQDRHQLLNGMALD